MKRNLIIQTDTDYFLFETIHTLSLFHDKFNSEITDIYIGESQIDHFDLDTHHLNFVTLEELLANNYAKSYNLSLNEASWSIHASVSSQVKYGAYLRNNELIIDDIWSTYFLTLKSSQPFLNFHLVDIYKNILEIKAIKNDEFYEGHISKIIYGFSSPDIFSATEQEMFISEITKNFPGVNILDISETNHPQDFKDSLYIGPACEQALIGCSQHGLGLFLTHKFQGFNFIPYSNHHLVITSLRSDYKSSELINIIHEFMQGSPSQSQIYGVYQPSFEHLFGLYLKHADKTDESYPVYQCLTVLWNYLASLIDTPLDHLKLDAKQKLLLQNQSVILGKIIRLFDYLLDSLELSLKNDSAEAQEEALAKISEVDSITMQISESNSLLRSLLDFYRLRRSQPFQSTKPFQESLLLYSEQHQAMTALQELFNSTLKANSVKID